jgi:hypothetical protein
MIPKRLLAIIAAPIKYLEEEKQQSTTGRVLSQSVYLHSFVFLLLPSSAAS